MRPAFGVAIWLLFVVMVRASPLVPPPRALAAVELATVAFFHRGSARLLPVVLLLVFCYLYCAAQATARARREREAAQRTLRELRERPRSTKKLAEALASAPKPERIFSTEDCLICLEPLAEKTQGDSTARHTRPVSTLRCGHQFHAECVATWINSANGPPRCPTCVCPISLSRALLEGAMGVE